MKKKSDVLLQVTQRIVARNQGLRGDYLSQLDHALNNPPENNVFNSL